MAWEHLGHRAGITRIVESLNAEGNQEWVAPGELWLPESLSLKHRIIHLATQLTFVSFAFILSSQPDRRVSHTEPLPPTHSCLGPSPRLSVCFSSLPVFLLLERGNLHNGLFQHPGNIQWEMCSFAQWSREQCLRAGLDKPHERGTCLITIETEHLGARSGFQNHLGKLCNFADKFTEPESFVDLSEVAQLARGLWVSYKQCAASTSVWEWQLGYTTAAADTCLQWPQEPVHRLPCAHVHGSINFLGFQVLPFIRPACE